MHSRIVRVEPDKKPVLPRVGLIKAGYKHEKGYPVSTDYFIPKGKYETHFRKAYGEKPNTIQVVFLDDDAREVCFERYEFRDHQGKLVARGDGENFEVWTGEQYEDFTTKEHPKLMDGIEKKNPKGSGWEVILTLKFILPKVRGIAGFWEFSTKGEESSIPQIRDTFDMMLNSNGFVKGVIFDLSVEFAKSQKPGKANRYPVVCLVPNESEDNRKMIEESILSLDSQRSERLLAEHSKA
jgi:hypothetical protein